MSGEKDTNLKKQEHKSSINMMPGSRRGEMGIIKLLGKISR